MTTLRSMRHMVVIVPELTGYASIRHIAVSLPYAAQLIDGVHAARGREAGQLGHDDDHVAHGARWS